MNTLPVEWNGRTIRRREDGYFNATDMCQATGKRFPNWHQNDGTEAFLRALSDQTGIPVNELIQSVTGIGTWVYPDVATALAMWCSPEFHVFVVGLVRQWAEGKLRLAPVVEDLGQDARAIIGGIIKSVVHKEMELLRAEFIASRADDIERIEAEVCRRLEGVHISYGDITVREALDEAGCRQKGRNKINRKIGYWLRKLVPIENRTRRNGPKGPWAFPRAVVAEFMRDIGTVWVHSFNAGMRPTEVDLKQGMLKFTDKNESATT